MVLEEVYNYIFPLGSVDNNNRYINMATDDIVTVQLLEPMVSVTEFLLTKKDRLSGTDLPDRLAFRLPVVSINDSMLNNETITNLCLDYSSFVPTIMIEFVDMNNDMLSTNSLRDGSIIKIYVGGNGDELYYKPIRQDFIITDIIKLNSGSQNLGEWIQYRIMGSLNVPMGHRKDSWSNNPATSMQELFNLAIYTGLGFATNFTYQTIDKMKWVNTSGGSFFEFMREIAEHACYSPNTFFTAFVDQYYVLNFVECHSLLSHGGKKTDTPAMIYPNYQDASQPNVDKSPNNGENKETSDQIDVPEGEDPLMNKSQKLSYYFITNHNYFDGWSNYIESYTEISDGYASMYEGYQKHLVYSDSNTCQWGSASQFNIRPIDNLKRDDVTQEILPLDDLNQETYIPSNLMQTNNSDYESGASDIDLMSGVESYVNLGEIDTSNMYKQYYFAEVQNQYQMRCMKKCGLNVTLQNYNPSITKFSRIWVDIYDMNPTSSQAIKPTKLDSYYGNVTNNKWLQYKENLNENIIIYEDEGFFNNETTAKDSDDTSKGKNTNIPRGNYNRSLSGWYVVTEMKITYDNFDKNMKTHLVLNRIEHKPTFKNEYDLAKSAIDKYKVENRAECIFGNIEDYSYSNDTSKSNNNSEAENTEENKEENKEEENNSQENNQGGNNQGGNGENNQENQGGDNQDNENQGGNNQGGNNGNNQENQGGENNQDDENNKEDDKPQETYDYDKFTDNFNKFFDIIESFLNGNRTSDYCENIINKNYKVISTNTERSTLNSSLYSTSIKLENKKNDVYIIELMYIPQDNTKTIISVGGYFNCRVNDLTKLIEESCTETYLVDTYKVPKNITGYDDLYVSINDNEYWSNAIFFRDDEFDS